MNKFPQYVAQVLAYAFFMFFIAYFSSSPDWYHSQPENATVKVSIRHPGKLVGECRELSEEEMAKLPPNMKVPKVCPRERSPVKLSIEMDDKILYESNAQPSGLQKDGVSTFYGRFEIPRGDHLVRAVLRDDVNNPDQGYSVEKRISVKPRQVLVIDFKDGFIFK